MHFMFKKKILVGYYLMVQIKNLKLLLLIRCSKGLMKN